MSCAPADGAQLARRAVAVIVVDVDGVPRPRRQLGAAEVAPAVLLGQQLLEVDIAAVARTAAAHRASTPAGPHRSWRAR